MIADANNGKKRKAIWKMWNEGYFLWRIMADCKCSRADVEDVVADKFGVEAIEIRISKRASTTKSR